MINNPNLFSFAQGQLAGEAIVPDITPLALGAIALNLPMVKETDGTGKAIRQAKAAAQADGTKVVKERREQKRSQKSN